MDLRRLRKFAKAHGWTTEIRRSNHVAFIDPEGRCRAVAANSASDHRSLRNTIAHLRAAGLAVPHKGGRAPRERKTA